MCPTSCGEVCSGEAEKAYEGMRGKRRSLDAVEYYAVTQDYLREWVCMGQCNLYIQMLSNPLLKQSMETYRHDVCEPNLTEMRDLLEAGVYALPAPYNAERDARSLGHLDTDVIDDRMILVGHIFAVEAFMNRWNEGGAARPPRRGPRRVPAQLPPGQPLAPGRDRDGRADAVH